MSSSSPSQHPNAVTAGTTLIRLEGQDALPLLHRISTQALADLEPGQARATLFCDFRGRLLHRAIVALTEEGAVWLLRDDAPGDELLAFIDQHVFREDVRITDAGAGRTVRAAEGPADLAPGTLVQRDAIPYRVQIAPEFGYSVLAGPPPLADPDAERRRIIAGRVRHGHEIALDFTPFEVGLAHEVHLNKGCFTGQEALMRTLTYRSVRRALAATGGFGKTPEAPKVIRRQGRACGVLTSAAPREHGWVGLAVLKHEILETPGSLEIEGAGVVEPPAPFAATRPLGLPES